jgi:hypothetical protein
MTDYYVRVTDPDLMLLGIYVVTTANGGTATYEWTGTQWSVYRGGITAIRLNETGLLFNYTEQCFGEDYPDLLLTVPSLVENPRLPDDFSVDEFESLVQTGEIEIVRDRVR